MRRGLKWGTIFLFAVLVANAAGAAPAARAADCTSRPRSRAPGTGTWRTALRRRLLA